MKSWKKGASDRGDETGLARQLKAQFTVAFSRFCLRSFFEKFWVLI